ncbi:hypothetical protein BF49_5926 [Bradyrhizobium sp.]|nr:hypothetical protein BF49_5926 [Bradyrhizobium sp.]
MGGNQLGGDLGFVLHGIWAFGSIWPFLGTSGGLEKPFMAHFPAVPRFAAGGCGNRNCTARTDRI